MKILVIILISVSGLSQYKGQDFNENLDKDSVFRELISDIAADEQQKLLAFFGNASEEEKELYIFMASMPESSKKELIENIETNRNNITNLHTEYSKLVPEKYIVSIELNPGSILSNTHESMDLKISEKNKDGILKTIFQEWNLECNMKKLPGLSKLLAWDNGTLSRIKRLLDDAKSISIENGDITTIGFARSGMGKYSIKIFKQDLTKDQIVEYNDGCTYIFHKNNIVLEYGGGAFGPQCFPDE